MMSKRTSQTHLRRSFRDRKWPYQWVGQCSCGAGIRCNSKADVAAFFKRMGCEEASRRGN